MRSEADADARLSGAVVDYLPPERTARLAPPLYAPVRRSVLARVAISVLLALAFFLTAAAAYFAARSDVLNTLVAAQSGPAAAVVPSAPAATVAAAPPAAAQAPAAAAPMARPAIPNVQGLVVLIRSAISALEQANETGNYAVLHAIAAPVFQARNSPASLSEAFASLRTAGADLGAVNVVNPRLYRDPLIDDNGYLRLAGFFPIGKTNTDFEMAFQMIDGRWRLFGVGVHPPKDTDAKTLQPAADAAGKVPEAARLVTLIRGAVLALTQANSAGDYSVLRDLAAPGFREANDLPRLAELFSSLRKRQLDLSPVAVIDPQLARPPTIDKNGYLRLAGRFDSRPEAVNFELAFAISGGRWRLFGIGLEAGAN